MFEKRWVQSAVLGCMNIVLFFTNLAWYADSGGFVGGVFFSFALVNLFCGAVIFFLAGTSAVRDEYIAFVG